ncbi:hypothetical protein [Shouchella miscanthi]|uniref:hypothetical protein n=1 Tax=Shouchella miscanthi TaxID=2598861 RepID=UPI0011A0BDF4|nr:hypothetical protein [Shouchella miscanthi]
MDLKQHLEHPFYKEAHEYREAVRREQIEKGCHKYPKPFTPSDWSNSDLAKHAMQENVDQAVYISGMLERMEEQQDFINRLYIGFVNVTDEHKQYVGDHQVDKVVRETIRPTDLRLISKNK